MTTHAIIAHSVRQRVWRFAGPSGTTRDVALTSIALIPEPAVLRTMLGAGAGIGWLPDFQAVKAIAEGSLVRLLPD